MKFHIDEPKMTRQIAQSVMFCLIVMMALKIIGKSLTSQVLDHYKLNYEMDITEEEIK